LMVYSWPGNVRELRTAVEHAVVLARSEKIAIRDLPPGIRGGVGNKGGLGMRKIISTPEITVKEAEKQLISRALAESHGNRTIAAKKIGMSRRTLHRKLHTYHLEGH